MHPEPVTADRIHDLPPLWDGRAVQWSDWSEQGWTTLVFHVPADHFACTGCGWIRDTELRAVGTLMPPDGVTDLFPVIRLIVRRCPGCHLDQVTDVDTWDVWDLEPRDYTDAGSWPDDLPVQGTLF
jgi:hypothetical protein